MLRLPAPCCKLLYKLTLPVHSYPRPPLPPTPQNSLSGLLEMLSPELEVLKISAE